MSPHALSAILVEPPLHRDQILAKRAQHLAPSGGGGNDFIGIGGPDKRLWLLVVVDDEAVDVGLQIDDAFEDPAFEAALGEDGEETFDGVEPTGRGRREVKSPARMTPEPLNSLGVLVGGVVVEDGVDGLSGRDLTLDGVQEADELLMAVACMQRPMTLPSSTSKAAKRVVVPWRL